MARTMQLSRWWKAIWCAICTVCLALVPLAAAVMASPGVERAAADEPSAQMDEPVSYAPKLFKMLAINDHIDTAQDELRMDFVLRVAHGQVNSSNPVTCATGVSSSGRSCGLRLYFQNAASATKGLSELTYVNTMGSGLLGAAGALVWAQNQDQRYTIHSIVNSGAYDYLTISIEGDLIYTDTVDRSVIGGVTTPQYVYAQVQNSSGNWVMPPSNNRADTDYWTNLTADYPAHLYAANCSSTNTSAQCNGPRAFVGWDALPALWSLGQANWGLMTDVGINVVSGTPISAGTAPPNSFFVYWYNPWYNFTVTNTCSRNTSFYFQWLGLKGGKDWVPVNDLTPTAQRVDGQLPQGASPAAASTGGAAFNRPTATNHDIRARAGISMAPAQHSDGTIDFKKAKEDQPELDGYFKLVTWPITTDASGSTANCVASNMVDAYNPLEEQPNGVTEGMSQSDANALIDKGWAIDTAFYKYSLPVVQPPVIDTPANNSWSATAHPTVGGTGIAGHVVDLYAEDPNSTISSSDPDNPDTRGRYVGQATVGPDGRWSIVDSDNTVSDGSVRYHAWQVEPDSGYSITSVFSNIQTVKFVPPPVVLPALTEIPHTKVTANGELPTNSKVKIHGTVKTPEAGLTLRIYATNSATGTEIGDGHPAGDKLLCTLTGLPLGQQDWTCEADPSFFLNQSTTIDTYVFQAYLSDGTNETGSSTDRTPVRLDMIPPRLDDNKVENGTLSGTATSVYSNHAGTSPEAGVVMHVTWPGGATAQTTTDASGNWSVAVPNGLTSGNIQVYGVDVRTNETAIISVPLQVIPPAKALPFTGETSRLPWVIAVLSFALMATGFGLYLFIDRRMKSGKAVDDP